MISSDIMRGYNDIMILFLLLEHDSYGYEISKEIQTRTKSVYSMKETTLYSAINRLEKSGYIASYHGSESFGKPRTYFTITNAGRTYYREKCSEWKLTRQIVDYFTNEKEENVHEYE